MGRLQLHRQNPLRGVHGGRMIVVLMVVAAGVLLAVPATAGAHVAKAHKAQFRKSLNAYDLMMSHLGRDFDGGMTMLAAMSDEMAPLIGSTDPRDLERLHEIERIAGDLHDGWFTWWNSGKPTIDKSIDRSLPRPQPPVVQDQGRQEPPSHGDEGAEE